MNLEQVVSVQNARVAIVKSFLVRENPKPYTKGALTVKKSQFTPLVD